MSSIKVCDVGCSCFFEQHLVHGLGQRIRVDSIADGEAGLWVEIDDEHARPAFGKRRAEH